MQPDVSFLIPAFNAASTLARALQSALSQRGVSVEVIVVDDCSTDATAQIARSIGDERVKVLRLDRNKGPGGARNAGLPAATGRFIAVLDADDAVHPDRSARLVARIEETAADCVVDNIEVASGGPPQPMFAGEDLAALGEMSLATFVDGNHLFAGGFNFGYLKPMFRASSLRDRAVRYPEAPRIGEDFLFLATVLASGGRCVVEPTVGYTYHVTGTSISRVLRLSDVREMIRADRDFLADHDLNAEARAAFRARARSLRQAASFLEVVEAIKARSPLRALRQAARDPLAMRHFRMPVEARLKAWTTKSVPAPSPVAERPFHKGTTR